MSHFVVGALALFALVLATRALGQSALSVASITAVGKSFGSTRRRGHGRVLGPAERLLCGRIHRRGTSVRVTAGGPPGCRSRSAWRSSSAPVTLLLRERFAPTTTGADGARGEGLPLAAALRTPAFWVFGGATSLFGLVSSGLGLFNEAVLAERGFDQQTYVSFWRGRRSLPWLASWRAAG